MPLPIGRRFFLLSSFAFLLFLASCSFGALGSTPTPSLPPATPTPPGPQTLNICLGAEPSSLYLYADNSATARAIRQAIYDGPFDVADYQSQPVLFESAPAPAVQTVTVREGDLVVDADGRVAPLAPGARVRTAGCRDGNCVVEYAGGELQMDQVSVTFTLKAGLLWSDGTPLTAGDSVYSFQVASAAETPGSKDAVLRTASYSAADERSLTWVGLPGYVDPAAATRFWTPLPQHAWGGTPAADLLSSDMANRTPLGWGPYVITQWLPGQRIELARNPNYAGAAEGLPYFSTLNFVFIGSEASTSLNALADGTCDVLTPSTGLETLESTGMMGGRVPQDSWLHLDFSLRPRGFDDGFNVYADRADFFGNVTMRQAFAQCIDRSELAAGLDGAAVASSYVAAGSPQLNASASLPAYDPAAANTALDQLGWLTGADGVRTNVAFPGAAPNQRLELTLVTSDGRIEQLAAQVLQSQLADCGVALNISSLPAAEAFAIGPDSPIFGRNFDLALFAWPYGEQPACFLYAGEAIPGEGASNKYGWGGWNVSGWQNAEFDTACQVAQSSLPSEAGYAAAVQQGQAIFAQELPALPLVTPLETWAARPDFCHFEPQAGETWLQGIEAYGYGFWCQ